MPDKTPTPTLPLKSGAAYVNPSETIARKIIAVLDNNVLYADFGWPDGMAFSPESMCGRSVFRKWASRQLSEEEAAKLPSLAELVLGVEKNSDVHNAWCLRRLILSLVKILGDRVDQLSDDERLQLSRIKEYKEQENRELEAEIAAMPDDEPEE